MQIVEFDNGDLILNWNDLPDNIKSNMELRDNIMNELKQKYENVLINPKILFEMNKYVVNRIKSMMVR